jgi:16S rRNA (guanine(966)-N(2))-methyltransferase RsmD
MPKDSRVRPTADRVREAWMSILGQELSGARVLDLFAGSGALGLEALSRGAASVSFVELNPASLRALDQNIAALGVDQASRLVSLFRQNPFGRILSVEHRSDLTLGDSTRRYGDTAITFCHAP